MSQNSITAHAAHTSATARLARFARAHRRLVVVWLLLLPAGIYGANHVSNRLNEPHPHPPLKSRRRQP
jgi:hypothetical protein